MIFLKKVSNKKDLRNFVIFPFELYKGSKYWIPPIINQEMNSFNKDLNPNLQDSKVEGPVFLWLFLIKLPFWGTD